MFFPKFKWFRRFSWLIGTALTFCLWAALGLIFVWGVSSWYNYRQGDLPLTWGVSWSDKQAAFFDLDTKEDLDYLLSEIPFKRLQLMSYWDQIETTPGDYDFSSLETQFEIARSRNVSVSLQLGLHQSRWPFCHAPNWSQKLDSDQFKSALQAFISQTVAYGDSKVNLIQYQLEPEIFKAQAASCVQQLTATDLGELHTFVTQLTTQEIALSRPHNRIIWRSQMPEPAAFGLCLKPYPDNLSFWQGLRRPTPPGRYYTFIAGNLKILHSQSQIFIRALSAEPRSLDQDLSSLPATALINGDFNNQRLQRQIDYARSSNIKIIDLKGAEWWLWQKRHSETSFWDIVRENVQNDF